MEPARQTPLAPAHRFCYLARSSFVSGHDEWTITGNVEQAIPVHQPSAGAEPSG